MRIAVIEPLPRGGLLHYATQLADALAEQGDEVDLIVAKDSELAERSGPARRREVLPREVLAPADPTPREAMARRARTAVRLLRTWAQIAYEVRRRDYDAILIGGSFDMVLNAAGGLLASSLHGASVLAHVCHNVRPLNRWGGADLYVESGVSIALMRRLYPRFDLVFVHGERSEREFKATWPPTRLAIVPHGDERLFAEQPPPPSEEPRILFFGAWRKMKGLPVLMEAFDALTGRRPEVRLTIAGPPVPEEGESQKALEWASQRAERVEVAPGYVPIEDVAPLFARARVVVAPYLTGYQSGVVHLAMTMGRAVVASDVGDLTSVVIDGETGLVVPPRDPRALAAALERVLDDPALAQRLGAAGRERLLESAGWPKVAAAVHDALQHAMEARSR